jgi:hypothetical protein
MFPIELEHVPSIFGTMFPERYIVVKLKKSKGVTNAYIICSVIIKTSKG